MNHQEHRPGDDITGRPSQPSLGESTSHASAPMVGNMRDANWRIASLYRSATRTGFGRVFVIKLTSVCRWGRMLESSGALVDGVRMNTSSSELHTLGGCRIGE